MRSPTRPRVIHLDSAGKPLKPADYHRSTGVIIDPRDKTVGNGNSGKRRTKGGR